MYCLIQREINGNGNGANGHDQAQPPADGAAEAKPSKDEVAKLPAFFSDPGFNQLATSVLSTSNCGNPALRVSAGWRSRDASGQADAVTH